MMKTFTHVSNTLRLSFLMAATCLCATTFVSCSSDESIEVITEENYQLPDSPSDYVVPVSAETFNILGNTVNIYDLSSGAEEKFEEIITSRSGLPKNYTNFGEDGLVYTDTPSFTTQYSLSDLDGFYVVQVDSEEAMVGLIVGNHMYAYKYELQAGIWVRVPVYLMIDYIDFELTETENDCITFSYNLPDTFSDFFIAQYVAKGLGTQEQAEAMIADEFASTTLRIVNIDKENHVVVVAIHYNGEKALEVATDYGLAEDDDDFWVLENLL